MVALPLTSMVKAHELLWEGKANIYSTKVSEDGSTCLSDGKPELLFADVPCHLSFARSAATKLVDLAEQSMAAVLFLAPTLTVPAGCKVEVWQKGRQYLLRQSGKALVYAAHQEIALELEDKYA